MQIAEYKRMKMDIRIGEPGSESLAGKRWRSYYPDRESHDLQHRGNIDDIIIW
jgi:hypothetical protein